MSNPGWTEDCHVAGVRQLGDERDRAVQRAELLIDVLEWYANEETYTEKESICCAHKFGENMWTMIDVDKGKYARSVLQGLEEKGEDG